MGVEEMRPGEDLPRAPGDQPRVAETFGDRLQAAFPRELAENLVRPVLDAFDIDSELCCRPFEPGLGEDGLEVLNSDDVAELDPVDTAAEELLKFFLLSRFEPGAEDVGRAKDHAALDGVVDLADDLDAGEEGLDGASDAEL